jgi:hypothetical protein
MENAYPMYDGEIDFVADKVVTVTLRAEAPHSFGTALIDIRRSDYSGGSLRSMRISVDYDSHNTDNGMRMPLQNTEQMLVYLETHNPAAPPLLSIRTDSQ